MDKFLETYNLAKLNQEEEENLNRLITDIKIEAVMTNSRHTKAQDQMISQANFIEHSKNN